MQRCSASSNPQISHHSWPFWSRSLTKLISHAPAIYKDVYCTGAREHCGKPNPAQRQSVPSPSTLPSHFSVLICAHHAALQSEPHTDLHTTYAKRCVGRLVRPGSLPGLRRWAWGAIFGKYSCPLRVVLGSQSVARAQSELRKTAHSR